MNQTKRPDVLLVTSWNAPCGIAEHSAYLKEAVESQSDLTIEVTDTGAAPPKPELIRDNWGEGWPIIHLNYHAALHSQWVPEWLPVFQRKYGAKVVVTFHDTGVPNSVMCRTLHDAADAFVIHEPGEDVPRAYYHRMGVPGAEGPMQYGKRSQLDAGFTDEVCFKRYATQPVLGTIGFPSGWKNYDQLAKITAEQGWALLLLAPGATDEQIALWRALNPDLYVHRDFTPRRSAISYLAGCDATAFVYVCHNTGQSASILQGIAARKSVIALSTCRQFRALYLDPIGRATIKWAETFEDVAAHLRCVKMQRVDTGIVALAEQESWQRAGRKYIDIYRSLL